ncbi:hypothetical protein NQ314_005192 [Rhamnusium bicolor]|uniref:Uncharacterized protein n=1 Tax=Rhamnusium bicolor TaxID=1586634 RepID=A0AAV8ZHQ0_9CUCU|nr:hypothetical protein NQ314_005192 [Rhamnusium bicolor]
MKATLLVSISAERYGSVQHEERLTESVNLMVNHVQMLKQQRDSARRQLQYTKLGGDLVKIHEGFAYDTLADKHQEDSQSERENNGTEVNNSNNSSPEETQPPIDLINLSIRSVTLHS